MKQYLHRGIAHRLETARLTTTNAVTPALKTILTAGGLAETHITSGAPIYQAASGKVGTSAVRRGEQMIATAFARECYRDCRQGCQALAKTARAAFRDEPETLSLLGLDAPMPKDNNGFLATAEKLLNTTAYTSDMRTTLATYGYTDAKLSGERAKLQELRFALDVQAQTKAAHQQSKVEQRTALKAMDKWMGSFVRVARVALADKAQLLEQLGIVVPTFPTPAQRAGRAKAAATRMKKKLERQTMNMPKAA